MTQSTSDATAASPLPSPKERRRLREAKSLTEEQVAAAVGVTRATVRAWETGRTSPRGRKREAYARLLTDTEAVSRTAPATEPSEPSAPPPAVPVEAVAPDEAVGRDEALELDEAVEVGEVAPAVEAGEVAAAVAPVPPEPDAPPAPPAAPDTAVDDAVDDSVDDAETAGAAEGGLSPAEAFDALYQHAASALFRQTYLLTGRHTLSRAAVAKAFELAWERWPEVAVDRDPVGWVRAAAYEYAMSPWRRLNREHRRPDPPPEAPDSRALLDALLALPPSYRRTLVLHDGVGLGLPDTAAETEASTRAAAGRLVTARAAVAERLPEVAGTTSPDARSALIHEHLGTLARSRPAASLPVPELIRTGSERKAQLWARTAIAFTVLIVGLTLITLATAPRKYETPPSPAQKVGGVPPVGGPQKLTPQDVKLRKQLGDELFGGPARLVPETG
ncbi:helix-turn-helix domain-containing protein [Streptomyces sp. NBC_01423]|uniref:helix-turn-helix domain-containing protein n=1 Tax=Streptomyces sp. NBC_01423 TaxID=2903860 RepID=UPI002E2B89A6|nr:helix-turn-helix domain-containing protein [Streptomyces sp. NBC_01423]